MTAWTANGSPGDSDYVPAKDQYIFGLMCWGQNPAVGGPSSSYERRALANLDWLVCVDLWETETAAFWKPTVEGDGTSDSLGIPGVHTQDIETEVFLLPAACSYEKEGSITNSGRWSQWRYQALDAPGHALDDLSIINELAKRLKALYQPLPSTWHNDAIRMLWWGPYCDPNAVANPGLGAHYDAHGGYGGDYDDGSPHPNDDGSGIKLASAHKVSWEINGYFCPTSATPNASGENPGAPAAIPGTRVNGFWGGTASTQTLRYGGETTSGNWLYCSHYINPGGGPGDTDASAPNGNRQEKRDPVEVYRADGKYIGLFSNWSYCWPLNRRIIYNGASVYQPGHSPASDVGQPLAPNKWVVAWDSGGTIFRAGSDVSDGYKPPGSPGNRYPFIMQREGVAHLFGPGRVDGPFPEHYEPWESVLTTNPISGTLHSPTLFAHYRPAAYERPPDGDPEFPIVGTTYRVSEHWQAGQMTRNLPWQCQLQPNAFVELSEELATLLGIVNGDTVEIKTKRSEYYISQGYGKRMQAVACVTKRFKPYTINGGTVHHVGMIWSFGYTGCCTGYSANLLTPHIGDANTGIPESKAFICNIRKYNPSDDLGWLP
jgi:formate dehydrogenase major subunit